MPQTHSIDKNVVIIGAGPAGLTAAYQLTKQDITPVVLEKSSNVGGISRTDSYKGFHFDMGGHRFFTKVPEVKAMWKEVLAEHFLRRPRMSRIYYNGKFFDYPLKPFNALRGMGVFQAILIMISYMRWQMFPHKKEDTFEQWVTNRFGKRLFLTFFKTYTEKVWGVSCSELKAEWAAQRIKDLSLRTAITNMFLKPQTVIKTLIEEFDYPKLGPGMMWQAVRDSVIDRGGAVRTEADVTGIKRDGLRVTGIVIGTNGSSEVVEGTDFISSMPVTELVRALDPPPAQEVLDAADQLSHRDFLTVCLIVDKPDLFPDNWVYIHDPDVAVGRIQNYKNWSPDMVPDQSQSGVGMEYFCTEGDELWTTSDEELIERAKREINHVSLANYDDIIDGVVIRVAKAYPVYDTAYGDHLGTIRRYVDSLENFQTIGRNGLHRYNNQDHAMMTGMLAVENLVDGEQHDLWAVNTDEEYHEEVSVPDDASPERIAALEAAFAQMFSKLDRVSFGAALGAVGGIALALATAFLVAKQGPIVGPHLGLLGEYFPGYAVNPLGCLLGLGYGFLTGFCAGWLFAAVRNATVFVYTAAIRLKAQAGFLKRFLEYV